MKFFIVLFLLLKFCSGIFKIPKEILDAKSAIEAEGNKEGFDNLKKIFGNESSDGLMGRVAGGNEAVLGQFPHYALLSMTDRDGYQYTCGGSLITYKTVLTAALCIEPFISFNVYLGIFDRVSTYFAENEKPLNHTFYHQAYDKSFFRNNIGLIYLQTTTQQILSVSCNCIGVVNLPVIADAAVNLDGVSAEVAGFGSFSDSLEGYSQVLRYANIPIVSNQQCIDTYGHFFTNESMLCASGTNGISSCIGDDGGSLVANVSPYRRVLVGLVSYGAADGCQVGYPTGHTRITFFLDWIDQYKDLTSTPSITTTTIKQTTTTNNPTSTTANPTTTTANPTTTTRSNPTSTTANPITTTTNNPTSTTANNPTTTANPTTTSVESLKALVEDLESKIENMSSENQKIRLLLYDAFNLINLILRRLPNLN